MAPLVGGITNGSLGLSRRLTSNRVQLCRRWTEKMPPFYLIVDEITVGRPGSSGADRREVRRAGRRRAAVQASGAVHSS